MIPRRKLQAKRAKAVFFRAVNEIDVFVEDTSNGTEKFYSILLEKALNNKYKVGRVIPLGGKLEVAKAWQERNSSNSRQELYIIDADFSLYGSEQNKHPYNLSGPGYYILKRFCIENYLIEEESIIKYLNDEDLNKDETEIKSALKYNLWVKRNRYQLYKLFIHMATVRDIDESVSVKRWRYSDIISSDDGFVNKTKVRKICAELKKEILQKVSQRKYRKNYSKIRSNLKYTEFDFTKHVCAKDYLLNLLILRMKKVTPFNASTKLLKQKIASRINAGKLVDDFSEAL